MNKEKLAENHAKEMWGDPALQRQREYAQHSFKKGYEAHESEVKNLRREKLAESILIALLQNPERYKYIAGKVESGELKQEEANLKNIKKAYKIADSFLNIEVNER